MKDLAAWLLRALNRDLAHVSELHKRAVEWATETSKKAKRHPGTWQAEETDAKAQQAFLESELDSLRRARLQLLELATDTPTGKKRRKRLTRPA